MTTKPLDRASGPWLSPKEAAAHLHISVDKIYDALHPTTGPGLRHTKLGHSTIRIRLEWLEDWALAHVR